jgi:hypothetical protein
LSSNRKTVIIAGAFYFIGIIAGIFSIAPAIDSKDYLVQASENANQVQFNALFQFIMTLANIGFAVILYPILRKFNLTLSLGFLSFKIIAAVLNMIGFISLLMILSLSQEFVRLGTPDLSHYQTLGDLLRSGRDFINHVAMILAMSIAGLMFYSLLYRTKLIPRWLSVWGLTGTVLTIIASLLVMFQKIDIITLSYIVLNLPLILIETVLAIWFIAKGFDPTVMKSITEKS